MTLAQRLSRSDDVTARAGRGTEMASPHNFRFYFPVFFRVPIQRATTTSLFGAGPT